MTMGWKITKKDLWNIDQFPTATLGVCCCERTDGFQVFALCDLRPRRGCQLDPWQGVVRPRSE